MFKETVRRNKIYREWRHLPVSHVILPLKSVEFHFNDRFSGYRFISPLNFNELFFKLFTVFHVFYVIEWFVNVLKRFLCNKNGINGWYDMVLMHKLKKWIATPRIHMHFYWKAISWKNQYIFQVLDWSLEISIFVSEPKWNRVQSCQITRHVIHRYGLMQKW